jgi:hypothetical protein
MKQYTQKQIIDIVAEAFEEATENMMNGETAVNLEFYTEKKGTFGVTFNIDLGRGGIDSYNESYVEFKDGTVTCRLGESLEGCGIEEEVEESLQYLTDEFHMDLAEIKEDMKQKTGKIFIDYDSMIDSASIHEEIEKMLKRLGVEYTESGDDESSIEIKYKYFK